MAERPEDADLQFQDRSLQGVSRTFALTIPQLPGRLRTVVGNAYLLCRIADTIEDCPGLAMADKRRLYDSFLSAVASGEGAESFAAEAEPLIRAHMTPAERELIANAPAVVRVTRAFRPEEQAALLRCLRVMSDGMERFQEGQFAAGLDDMAHLSRYCYHVAGVVGEMLTELFCIHDPAIAARREALAPFAVSFGEGLQLTNILKDIWDDKARGVCWLPRDVFARHGFDLAGFEAGPMDPRFRAAYDEVLADAHARLRDAMAYTVLIPRSAYGVRMFCAWAVYMAALTLGKLASDPAFAAGRNAKISRRDVGRIVLYCKAAGWSDTLLRAGFRRCAAGAPPPSARPD